MNEWQILKNGRVWHDRFDTEEMAEYWVSIYIEDGDGQPDDYDVVEMTDEEMDCYR